MAVVAGWSDKEGNSITWVLSGMYPSPCGKLWSSMPYNKEQKSHYKSILRTEKARDRVIEHLTRTNRTILEELELVKSNKSTLPRYAKNFLLELESNSNEQL